jgi:hypothetical protein
MPIIIDHFDKFPLKTKKLNDFKLFKLAYNLFIKKEHLSIESIEKLVKIKSSMNLGLSTQLKTTFANIKPNTEIAEVYYANIEPLAFAKATHSLCPLCSSLAKAREAGLKVLREGKGNNKIPDPK